MRLHLILGLALSLVCAGAARAADAALVEAARKEGSLNWYTVQTIPQLVLPLVAAFEKKYAIKVSYIRANSSEVVLRVLNEARAGRVLADVVDGTSILALNKDNRLAVYIPASTRSWPAEIADPNQRWVATNYFVNNIGINTDLVPAADAPKAWQDLLDPRWKGKMAWGSTTSASAGPGFIGLMIKEMGEEKALPFLQKLAAQQITALPVAARQILDQVIAGEYAMGLMIFNHHAVISAAKGAPVAWLPMSPSLVNLNVASVLAAAPHPNAARLFLDFMESDEGQKIFSDNDYLPANPNIAPKTPDLLPDGKRFRGLVLTGDEIEKDMPHWAKIFAEIFR